MKFHSSNAVSEKKILLEALTCSDNVFLLNRYKHVDQSRTWFGSKQRSNLEVLQRLLRSNQAAVMCPGQSGLSPEPSNQELPADCVQQVVVENTDE